MALTGEQLRAARAILKMTRDELAEASGVSAATIKRLEGFDGELSGHTTTIRALVSTFEKAGVQFIAENGGGAGVRFRKHAK